AVAVQFGAHGPRRRVDADAARLQAAEKLERPDDANEAVAAHPERAGVVEEDHAGGGPGLDRRREERADDGFVAARLADDRTPKRAVLTHDRLAPLDHRGAGGLGPSFDHEARRLALGVRVDDLDSFRNLDHNASFDGTPSTSRQMARG